MDDVIYRKDAIDTLKEHRALFCDNTPDSFSKLPYGEKCRVDELDGAIATLVNLPPAESERKSGTWIIYIISMHDGEGCKCSECSYEGIPYWNYCPNCGIYITGVQYE